MLSASMLNVCAWYVCCMLCVVYVAWHLLHTRRVIRCVYRAAGAVLCVICYAWCDVYITCYIHMVAMYVPCRDIVHCGTCSTLYSLCYMSCVHYTHALLLLMRVYRMCRMLCFLIFIGVELIYNVTLVSGVQQSDSVIHTHIATLL